MQRIILFLVLISPSLLAQEEMVDTLNLDKLVLEALEHNPEVKAADIANDIAEAQATQQTALDEPELVYMREGLPAFRWNEAMFQRIELMQRFRFPTKYSTLSDIADIRIEHAHHQFMEKASDVLLRLRLAYYELWYSQQAALLNRESARLMEQFTSISQTRYGSGLAAQQDVLKGYVEQAKLENQRAVFRAQEMGAKSMLMSILFRQPGDTLGTAGIPEAPTSVPMLDTLLLLAGQYRPMVVHDSMMVTENRAMLSMAKQEYLPDVKLGLQYMTEPMGHFKGWTVTAGVMLPFAPWTLGKASARVEEAEAALEKTRADFEATRSMVAATVRDDYYKAMSTKTQLDNYTNIIVPQIRQALQASLVAYQTGKTDFLMLLDSYRMFVELSMEKLMLRMQYEQAVASLRRHVGVWPDAGIAVKGKL